MTWSFDDKLPIYLQIIRILKSDLARGKYQPGEKLPAVREVAKALTINPNTVQKTYRQLEQRGLIYSLPGKGSYVAERSQYSSAVLEKATEEFRKAVEDGVKSGLTGEMMKAAVDAVVNKEGKV